MNYFQTGGDLFQWDVGRKVTLALPDGEIASVVEFTINNEANALVVDVKGNEAEIPNILLQTAGGLRMWAVTVTADGRQTRRYGSEPVYGRAKPDDYVYTETEVKRYEDFEERIKALEENGVGEGGGAVESVNGKTGKVTLKAEDVGAIPNADEVIQSNHLGSMVVKNANIAYGAVSDSRIAEKTITFQRLSDACVEDIKGQQYTAQQPTSAQQQVARDNIAAASQEDIGRLDDSKADKAYMTVLFEQLKALILAGDISGALAVLDQAILDQAILA